MKVGSLSCVALWEYCARHMHSGTGFSTIVAAQASYCRFLWILHLFVCRDLHHSCACTNLSLHHFLQEMICCCFFFIVFGMFECVFLWG